MNDQNKTKEQLIAELQELREKHKTEKASLEKALTNEKILLNTIINNIPSSVFVKDKSYRKLLANNSHISHMRAHLRSIGFDSNINLIGKTDFEVVSNERSIEYYADDQKVVEHGESILQKEEIGYDADGEKINQIITKVPLLDSEGEIIGMVGVTTDITELRQVMEEVKHKNKQLIKTNAEKDKFFSIIAHDLKSPFNSILGFSQLILSEIEEKNYNVVEEYAHIIYNSSSRAVDLLMNLMFWAQSQTGRIIYNPEMVSIEEVINEVFLLFEEIAKQKKVSLQMKLGEISDMYADKAMLSTIIRNLISNAIKYTYPEGTVIISSETIEDCIQISIKDSGVGIPEDVLKELFEINSTRSTPGTNKEKGTGLGLIICKEFVEQHNGKIWVESQKGEGSTFKFSLPIKNSK